MKDIIRKLKKQGIKIEGELHDFWFKHEDECIAAINHYGTELTQKTICILRWHTPLGKLLRQTVIDFIRDKTQKYNDYLTKKFRANEMDYEKFFELNFNELLFYQNDIPTPFNAALYQITDKAGQYSGWTDLRGINLEKTHFSRCIISNACFVYSNLNEAKFNQVKFLHTNFSKCNFEDASLAILSGKQSFSNSNMVRTLINAAHLDHIFFGSTPIIKKISYKNLLLRFFHKPQQRLETEFLFNEIVMTGNVEERNILEYAYWYENTIRMIENTSWGKGKARLFLSCLFTKNWSSILTVLSWDLFFILFFASCFFFLPENFNCLNPDVAKGLHNDIIQGFVQEAIGAIYYSVVTFTTLGYGDLVPITSLGRILVTVEVLIGYLFLGISAILVGRKIKV